VAAVAVPVPGGGRLLVVRDIEDQVAFARNLRRLAFGGVAGLGGIALALGWTGHRRYARRVAVMTATSRSIMAGDLSRRIPRDRSGDELDHLAENLNAMLGRIDDLMQALREVSDNIAHDLKTPLTRLRNRAEAALRDDRAIAHRDGLERTIEEADGLIQTFNALLLIARLEAGAVDQTRAACNLASLVSDVVELYQPVADEAGLTLDVLADAPAVLAVNRQLVGQAIANLIDNAIKYSAGTPTAAARPIAVSVVMQGNGAVAISVADSGPGIAPEDRERAAKRFVRLEQSRSRPGTGLGLSLVAAVARLHGGVMRLDDNKPGLKVTLVLPQQSGPGMTASSVLAER
jgi:signal transduction histidine kinase